MTDEATGGNEVADQPILKQEACSVWSGWAPSNREVFRVEKIAD